MSTSPLRVCITLGTRPEAIKLAPVIQAFRQSADFATHVVLTGQHREMVAQVMQLFQLEADADLDIMQPQQSLTDITCRSLQGLEQYFQQLQPDLVIVQGDTTTAFSAALAAFYQKIPSVTSKRGCAPMTSSIPFQKRPIVVWCRKLRASTLPLRTLLWVT